MSEYHLAWFARTHLQDGEGTYMLDDAPELNTGGMLFTATALFSSGIGVVNEDLIPYRGKNSKTESKLYLNYCYNSEDDWSVLAEYEFFQSYELENSDILQSPAVYDTFVTRDSEQDEREEGYLGYNQTATDEMKKQLMEGKAISVSFAADQASPAILDPAPHLYT